MLKVEVTASIGKDALMSALRRLTIGRDSFDPGPWSIADAEDMEAAARLIRREIEEARKPAHSGES